MTLPVFLYGHPVLRKVAQDITPEREGLEKLLANMKETMYKSDGIGLAAPQVGLNERIIVIDATPVVDNYPECKDMNLVLINPRITEKSGEEVTLEEGCLSLPDIHESVTRPTIVTVTYKDENFVEHTRTFTGYAARVIQHEYDHLEGHVFIDHISPIRKQLIKSKLNNIIKGKVRCSYRVKTV